MAIYKKCIPDLYIKSIYEINYDDLLKQGKKALLFDLDNTIIDYHQTKLTVEASEFLQKIEKDFKVLVISNSHEKRVKDAVGHQFKYVSFAKKPLKFGFKKALKMLDVKPEEVVMIGDQLMTDCFGGKRLGFMTILIEAVKRDTDKIWTRINRKIESYFLNKIKKKDPKRYEEVLKAYAER
ncbi:YqeG family HAD IIIA-type phosphatase [Acholeplasma equirhinis]|uniref:YqeG family HAD IIIA-type phosphatase n=1 Tax=Acholeplasma equirhinis TaxID=555393 RepID=UPI00197AAB84|nr:YqeG family HAD IIIA-type phosphatase [Acholeplasma equirhinis]MBN3490588.1 YqeG family HAD IIIA-type phosphatase [Acholeplasma equirhinis]